MYCSFCRANTYILKYNTYVKSLLESLLLGLRTAKGQATEMIDSSIILLSNNSELLRNSSLILSEFSHRILSKFFKVFIRILVASLSIQQFKWLSNSSKARWPQNFYKILLGFWSEFCSLNQKIRWPWNSYEILIRFIFKN